MVEYRYSYLFDFNNQTWTLNMFNKTIMQQLFGKG